MFQVWKKPYPVIRFVIRKPVSIFVARPMSWIDALSQVIFNIPERSHPSSAHRTATATATAPAIALLLLCVGMDDSTAYFSTSSISLKKSPIGATLIAEPHDGISLPDSFQKYLNSIYQ